MNMQLGLAGYFRFEAVNAVTGEKRLLSDWQPNLITEYGLERIGSGGCIAAVQVGSGQTTPTINDTQMAAFIAETTTTLNTSTSGASSTAPYYGFTRRVFRFAAGAAQGNLSEVGIRGGPSLLFSRSLIKDANGNPTTITVLANEFLDVTYELRIYAPTVDVTSQFTLNGQTHDCIVRASQCGNATFWSTSLHVFAANAIAGSGSGAQGCAVFTGDIGSVTQSPSGTTAHALVTQKTYSNNSRYLEIDCDFDLNTANFVGGVRSLRASSNIGCYQAQFDPPIQKDNTKSLKLTFRFHWARKP